MRKTLALSVGVIVLAHILSSVSVADSLAYQGITFPGSTFTNAIGINKAGAIVGDYVSSTGQHNAYLYENGVFTTLQVPNARQTDVGGINNAGQIVGDYIDSSGTSHGYLFAGGTFTTIDFPGSVYTVASGINNSGDIVGISSGQGFVLSNGHFSTFDIPGLATIGGINDAGEISGSYADNSNNHNLHGFLYKGGGITSIQCQGFSQAQAGGINDAGQVVVTTFNLSAAGHGFLLSEGCDYFPWEHSIHGRTRHQ